MVHEVISDGGTVWVNSVKTGGCLGRFSIYGVDIHNDVEEQATKGQCRSCTHIQPTQAEWFQFKQQMKEFYGVVVQETNRPRWLK